jgi:AcrR family transcriptional regulator
MGRWEPNARERLVYAAVDLFSEQGYDATTVSQIAERAGELTKTTFFRYFPDKREVLFAGQEVHRRILADAIAAAPDSATPLQAVAACAVPKPVRGPGLLLYALRSCSSVSSTCS